VVTAHLAKPVAPHDPPHLPTENELNDPNDVQLFLLGHDGGGDRSADSADAMKEAAAQGHQPATSMSMKDRGPTGELGFIR